MSDTPNPSPELPQAQGVSLDELTAAYAQAMGAEARTNPGQQQASPREIAAEDTTAESATTSALRTAAGHSPDGELDEPDDACEISPQTILEALLFVGSIDNAPLTTAKAAELMRGVGPEEISTLILRLNDRYGCNGCPYRIVSEGAGYRLVLRKSFGAVRNRFRGRARQARLSQAAIEVLAIVAYQQPLSSEQVNRLRATPSNHILSQLVRRRLLRVERDAKNRRKLYYRTSERFLDLFGLEGLDDLPETDDLRQDG